MSLPRPCRSDARSDAWPPAPKVASTTVSPGLTARSSRTSSASTGTWSVALREAFGNMLRTPFDLGQLLAPGRAVPDLEVVVDARDDDVARELRVLEQRRRQHQAPLLVELGLRGAGEEEPLHARRLLAERVERREPLVDELVPVRARVCVEAAVHPARDHDPVCECVPELRRERETVLVIDRVLVLAEKHSGPASSFPLSATLNHVSPHRNFLGPPAGGLERFRQPEYARRRQDTHGCGDRRTKWQQPQPAIAVGRA